MAIVTPEVTQPAVTRPPERAQSWLRARVHHTTGRHGPGRWPVAGPLGDRTRCSAVHESAKDGRVASRIGHDGRFPWRIGHGGRLPKNRPLKRMRQIGRSAWRTGTIGL
jgi:hypothetical protein